MRWKSRTQVNEYLPLSRRDPTRFEGAAMAWHKGLDAAGVSLTDLSFVETHDCFTVAELLEYEAMGLAPHFAQQLRTVKSWTVDVPVIGQSFQL